MDRSEPVRVGIAGVTDYQGREVARLLAEHPGFRVVSASSEAMAGKRLAGLDRDLGEGGRAMVVGHGDAVAAARDLGVELMFLATGPEASAGLARELRAAGIRVVDLSGAHRLRDPAAQARAYGFCHEPPDLAQEAVYGLTEWADRGALRGAGLVANAGGFPTAVLLALLPLAEAGLLDPESVVADGKMGTTGAGRSAKVSLLHSEVHGNFYADLAGPNRHVPEIAQALADRGAERARVALVAHLLPVARGVFVTLYLRVPGAAPLDDAAARVTAALRARYAEAPFVDVAEGVGEVRLDRVVGTNRCLLAAVGDPSGERVVVVAALDNLMKGGAGQALQNANLMYGLDEAEGLRTRALRRFQ